MILYSVRYVTYAVITYIVLAFAMIACVVSLDKTVILPGWYIYEISTSKIYWWTMLHQFLALNNYCISTTMFDTVVVGIMMQICVQIEIMKYRIFKISSVSNALKYDKIVNCIEHHLIISR